VSFGFHARTGDSAAEVVFVGAPGSGRPMLAMWLAAYGATGRSDSRRVRARWYEVIRGAPDGLWMADETIRHARALIAANHDNLSWITVCERTDFTIERGCKLKAPTDPPLVALVDYWQRLRSLWDDGDDGDLGVDLTARLAETFTLLLPELAPSIWHPTLAQVTDLFVRAAAAGTSVGHG
jgi:hypothetical protein